MRISYAGGIRLLANLIPLAFLRMSRDMVTKTGQPHLRGHPISITKETLNEKRLLGSQLVIRISSSDRVSSTAKLNSHIHIKLAIDDSGLQVAVCCTCILPQYYRDSQQYLMKLAWNRSPLDAPPPPTTENQPYRQTCMVTIRRKCHPEKVPNSLHSQSDWSIFLGWNIPVPGDSSLGLRASLVVRTLILRPAA